MGRTRRAKWAVAAAAAAGVILATGGLFSTCLKPQSEPMMGQIAPQPAGRPDAREAREESGETRIPSKHSKADANRRMERYRKQAPRHVPSLDFGESDIDVGKACYDNPAIEQYTKQNGVDPLFVRAVMAVESGFDRCHAAKVCHPRFRSGGCDNTGPDSRYENGIDEIEDPESGCALPPAPEIDGEPAWRWFGFGLGKTIGAPGEFRPEGSVEQECSDSFSPFNPDDAACAVSISLERAIEGAAKAVMARRDELGRSMDEHGIDDDLVGYVAANIYSGSWQSRVPAGHPRCGSAASAGECLMNTYLEQAAISKAYCGSAEGRADWRCSGGEPRYEPPDTCYGNMDIVAFARDCELPLRTERPGGDFGAAVMAAYYRLKNECRGRR